MIAYYAHPMAIYGTPQEEADIKLIESLGFECLNPNSPSYQGHTMNQFCALAARCDLIVFRAFEDGMIGSGVAKEIEAMKKMGKPVLELTGRITRRALSREETRERLARQPQIAASLAATYLRPAERTDGRL